MNEQTKELAVKIEDIRKTISLKISSYRTINKGAESFVIEVNKKWIFRFPRSGVFTDQMKRQWKFLDDFSRISPISVPIPKYVGEHFIGYKKLEGESLHPRQIEKLTKEDKLKISKQLGLFLKTLHGFKDKQIGFDTGYLIMRKDDYRSSPKELAIYLSLKERRALNAKLKAITENSRNFAKPRTIIHGDLNFNNIVWDKSKKAITGIIDWSDMGLGIPAMDFIGLADFNKKTNDQFLRDILGWYGTKNDRLFLQIKENSIIDVMNWFWFYKKNNDRNGASRILKRIKGILNQ